MTRNVVLVTIDSLRADHCGHWGYHRDTTPTLDALADEGLVFENAVSPGPATPESMPVIMTGMFPTSPENPSDSNHELVNYRKRIRNHMKSRETLAERFARAGYATAAFTPNPFTSRHFGFGEGFDFFQDFMHSRRGGSLYERVFRRFLRGNGTANLGRAVINRLFREEVFKPWESFYGDAITWANQQTGPYFLWLFLMDAHNPYLSSSKHRTQSRLSTFRANLEFWRQSHETPFSRGTHEKLVRAYDDAIRYTDACLSRLLDDLDSPLLVVHGDHGEAFGEHGVYGHEPYLYEENIHVPLVIGNASDDRIEEPFGLSALPHLLLNVSQDTTSYPETQNAAICRTVKGGKIAARGRNWKYIRGDGECNLYDLRRDEATDRKSDFPDVASLGQQTIESFSESMREHSRIRKASGGIDA